MDSITVTTEDLNKAASEVDSLADEYTGLYEGYLKMVQEFTTTDYKGDDADTFRNQVEGFRDDFVKMKQLMNEYASFLRKAAADYEAQQANAKAQASSLQN